MMGLDRQRDGSRKPTRGATASSLHLARPAATTRAGQAHEVVVPGMPVPKSRPRVVDGHTYTPRATRQFERLVWAYARQAGMRAVPGPVGVWLDFYLPRPLRCDLDNLVKTVLDALNGVAYADDRQVRELICRKHFCASDMARTEVCVYPCPEVTE